MKLRSYQQKQIDDFYNYLKKANERQDATRNAKLEDNRKKRVKNNTFTTLIKDTGYLCIDECYMISQKGSGKAELQPILSNRYTATSYSK